MSTQGKTPQEWAEYLPEPIRSKFLGAINPIWVKRRPNLPSIASVIDNWVCPGYPSELQYWIDIHYRAINGEFSKPIPKIEPKPTEKMTAVEWLVTHFKEYGVDFSHHEREIDQAKAMEKEQIEKAFDLGHENGYDEAQGDGPAYENSNQYYNETFGGDK